MKTTLSRATAILMLLTACASAEYDEGVPAGVVSVATERLANPQVSGMADAELRAVRTRDEWAAYWAVIHANQSPRPSLPEVDFDRETVLVAAMGRQETGGHEIRIGEVLQSPAGLVVIVTESHPAEDCAVTQAVTAPVDVVRVPTTASQVRFIERSRVRACR